MGYIDIYYELFGIIIQPILLYRLICVCYAVDSLPFIFSNLCFFCLAVIFFLQCCDSSPLDSSLI